MRRGMAKPEAIGDLLCQRHQGLLSVPEPMRILLYCGSWATSAPCLLFWDVHIEDLQKIKGRSATPYIAAHLAMKNIGFLNRSY